MGTLGLLVSLDWASLTFVWKEGTAICAGSLRHERRKRSSLAARLTLSTSRKAWHPPVADALLCKTEKGRGRNERKREGLLSCHIHTGFPVA